MKWSELCLVWLVIVAVGGCGNAERGAEEKEKSTKSQTERPSKEAPPAIAAPNAAKNDDKDSVSREAAAKASLERQVKAFRVPPDWLDEVESTWDVAAKPWKEGRIEIRRLLGTNDEASRKEGIKLTWDYLQKKDIELVLGFMGFMNTHSIVVEPTMHGAPDDIQAMLDASVQKARLLAADF